MKFKLNTKTMTPHDAAGKFFPEFASLVIRHGDRDIVGHCMLDIDDKGRAVLSFEDEVEQEMQAVNLGRVFRK